MNPFHIESSLGCIAVLTLLLACSSNSKHSAASGGAAGSATGGTGGTNSGGASSAGASQTGGGAGAAGAATTTTVTSITKDGITWTFSAPVQAGQFVTGDWFVIGPTTVSALDPAPTTADPYMNGSVLNLPTTSGKSGFDSRLNDGADESWWFDATLRSNPPIALKAGDALVSSISLATIHSVAEVMRQSAMNASPVRTVSVLTVLDAAPPSDAFRPSYCDRTQTIRRAGPLHRELLPALAPPNASQTPTLKVFEDWFRRPWIDTNAFLFDVPAEYMPSYGQHVAFAVSYATLLLTLNTPADQKVPLTNYLVQYGIDLYGCVKAGYGWPAFGGHRSGRKLPILLSGLMLGDTAMTGVSTDYPNQFGEDMQTLYVNQLPGNFTQAWQGATVIYGGHYGVDQSTGAPTDTSSGGLYAPYEQLQPSAWPILSPPGEQLGEAYRRCCTSVAWVGEGLAARLLKLDTAWNHPAFFDYVDRWMREDDTQAVADIQAQSGYDYSADWERQGQTKGWLGGEFPQSTFIDDMWAAYR